MAGIAVISNPNARHNTNRPHLLEALRAALPSDGFVVSTQTVEDIPDAVREFIDRDIEYLAINGGDGTLHYTISSMVPLYAEAGKNLPAIVLLRGGTMNTISKGLDAIAGEPLEILNHVVSKYERREPFSMAERHTLDINHGSQQGFLFGLGLASRFLRAYYEGDFTGPAKGAYVTARLFGSALIGGSYANRLLEPVKGTVIGDGKHAPWDEFSLIFAASVTEIGLGFKLFRRTISEPGRFELRATPLSMSRLAAQIRRAYRGDPFKGESFEGLFGEVVIEVDPNEDYMVDGDIKTGVGRFRLTAGPRVRFVLH